MKILSTITLSLITTSSIYAQTTMCFKENHPSMNTIENTKLDGGECLSQYTLKEMKEKGWKVNDIKISQSNSNKFNFVYILKKGEQIDFAMAAAGISQEEMEDRILDRIEKRKQKEQKEAEEKRIAASINAGKELYINKCQSCHGPKGELTAMNVSNPLNTLSYYQMQKAIDLYVMDNEYGNSRAMIMRPIAANISEQELKNVSAYIESINPKAK